MPELARLVSLPSRIKGALYGLAVCDALGGPVEFKARGSFEYVTAMLPNGNFGLPAGCFTDDTSMALCLAHSLLESQGKSDILDQVKKYVSWWQTGYMSSTDKCFDIGNATRNALDTWDDMLSQIQQDDAFPVERTQSYILSYITDDFAKEHCCGNGSLMRVLPTALISPAEPDAVKLAHDSSLPTHPHPRCIQACMIYTTLVHRALKGASKTDLALSINDVINHISADTSTSPIDSVLAERFKPYRSLEDWKTTSVESIRSTGYVVDTLEASLWAFFTCNTFEDAAIRAVNLGDDADTVGAICGGLAGAYHGFEAIPEKWLRKMRKVELLEQTAQQILIQRNATV